MTEFAAARARLVDSQLKTEGVTDSRVLAAMGEVPRERFVPRALKALAYIDEDIPIKDPAGDRPGRYLMEAAPFARLLQAAGIDPEDHVLVVGAAGGYPAAVVARLGKSVVALECDAALAAEASAALGDLGAINAKVVIGPLEQGFPSGGPYDAIVLDGSVETIPDALLDQLKEGGRLAAVVGYGRAARAMLYARTDGAVAGRAIFEADIRPLPGFKKAKAFVF